MLLCCNVCTPDVHNMNIFKIASLIIEKLHKFLGDAMIMPAPCHLIDTIESTMHVLMTTVMSPEELPVADHGRRSA